jgi:hypothetical protein
MERLDLFDAWLGIQKYPFLWGPGTKNVCERFMTGDTLSPMLFIIVMVMDTP